jgi:hypothetical protein
LLVVPGAVVAGPLPEGVGAAEAVEAVEAVEAAGAAGVQAARTPRPSEASAAQPLRRTNARRVISPADG